jgi:uncharacterized membrane-anchored protein
MTTTDWATLGLIVLSIIVLGGGFGFIELLHHYQYGAARSDFGTARWRLIIYVVAVIALQFGVAYTDYPVRQVAFGVGLIALAIGTYQFLVIARRISWVQEQIHKQQRSSEKTN